MKKFNSGDLVNGFQEVNSVIDEKGNFSFDLSIGQTEMVGIHIDNEPVFNNVYTNWTILINPGDSLHLDIPDLVKTDSENIGFSGTGFEKQLLLKDIANAINKHYRLNDLGEKAFKKQISLLEYYDASVQQAIDERQLLDSLLELNKYNLDKSELNSIRVFVLAKIYHISLDVLSGADLSSPTLVDYYKRFRENFPLNDLLIEDDLYCASDMSYDRVFIKKAYLDYLVVNRLPSYSLFTKQGRDLSLEYKIINEAYKNEKFKSRLLAGFIFLYGRRGWNEGINSLAQSFYKSVPRIDPFRTQVELVEKQMRISNDKSRSTYAFSLRDTSGLVRTSAEFKGKVMLIDFMFYGCGGCAQMTPYLEKIEEQFRNSKVVFLSVSADRTADILKKGIGIYSSKGSIPLYTNGEGFTHEILKFYNIESYPTVILIDKNGHIISTRAPDPRTEKGSKELTEMIARALE